MFIGVLAVGTNTVFAQSADRSLATHQKNDEGVLVVYPNPARDFLMVKTNDTSVQIKIKYLPDTLHVYKNNESNKNTC